MLALHDSLRVLHLSDTILLDRSRRRQQIDGLQGSQTPKVSRLTNLPRCARAQHLLHSPQCFLQRLHAARKRETHMSRRPKSAAWYYRHAALVEQQFSKGVVIGYLHCVNRALDVSKRVESTRPVQARDAGQSIERLH